MAISSPRRQLTSSESTSCQIIWLFIRKSSKLSKKHFVLVHSLFLLPLTFAAALCADLFSLKPSSCHLPTQTSTELGLETTSMAMRGQRSGAGSWKSSLSRGSPKGSCLLVARETSISFIKSHLKPEGDHENQFCSEHRVASPAPAAAGSGAAGSGPCYPPRCLPEQLDEASFKLSSCKKKKNPNDLGNADFQKESFEYPTLPRHLL